MHIMYRKRSKREHLLQKKIETEELIEYSGRGFTDDGVCNPACR